MFVADSQNFASVPLAPRGFTLRNFRPAFGGDHGGPWEEGCPSQIPLPPPLLISRAAGGCRVASGWAGSRCLPTPQRSGAAGCCRAGSGAAGCCRAGSGAAGCCRAGSGAAGCCRAGSGAAGCCKTICGAGTGAARGCCSGSGVSGTGPGSGTGWSRPPPPRHGAAPPPPPSLRGGAGQAQERGSATRGGRAVRGADRQGRPSQRRGAAARLPPRGGGLLSLGFTRQVQSSGGGGAQPPTAAPAPAGADGGAHSPRSGQGRSSEDPT